MNESNVTELLAELKEMPHGKLTAAVMLLSSYYVSDNMRERMHRAAEYLHNTVTTIKPSISEQLLLLTYQIIENNEFDSIFSEATPHVEELSAIIAEGSNILIDGVENSLFEPDDIREYFKHLYELSRIVMSPESDDRLNNKAVNHVLSIMEAMQQAV